MYICFVYVGCPHVCDQKGLLIRQFVLLRGKNKEFNNVYLFQKVHWSLSKSWTTLLFRRTLKGESLKMKKKKKSNYVRCIQVSEIQKERLKPVNYSPRCFT